MLECGECGGTIIDELLEGERIGRPKEVFHLDCFAEAEETYLETLESQEADREQDLQREEAYATLECPLERIRSIA